MIYLRVVPEGFKRNTKQIDLVEHLETLDSAVFIEGFITANIIFDIAENSGSYKLQ